MQSFRTLESDPTSRRAKGSSRVEAFSSKSVLESIDRHVWRRRRIFFLANDVQPKREFCLTSFLSHLITMHDLSSSLQGKLVQIEYALAAVAAGITSLGISATDGVVIATEKKLPSVLVDESTVQKISIL